MQNEYASAGNATESTTNPPGLYRHPEAKVELGAEESAAADAMVQQGYVLVKAGIDAARSVSKKANS